MLTDWSLNYEQFINRLSKRMEEISKEDSAEDNVAYLMNFISQLIMFQNIDNGITEALNKENELYGEERLINCLNRSDKSLSVEELLAFVRADVKAHVNGADQSDNITMLALKLNWWRF